MDYTEDRKRIAAKIPAKGWFPSIDIGDGWMPIIIELDRKLEELCPGYEIHQVKEKFGGLRFYWSGDGYEMVKTDQVNEQGYPVWEKTPIGEVVAEAEEAAYRTCEFCGEPGELRNDLPWLKTLCEPHYIERRDR